MQAAPSPFSNLGRYEVLDLIGSGGMGDVYRARDTRLSRIVAIKVLRQGLVEEPALRARFEREATALASLNHPHIGSVYDVGRHEGIEYLVMEYLEGETIEAKLRNGAVPYDQALLWAIQIAEAVDQAHRAGVLHRDLKPGNIMITKSGVKLLDFGLARRVLNSGEFPLTEEGGLLGTLPWMAPEQVEGKETDARSDLFSVGAILYQMLTGRLPFEAETRAGLISAILTSEPEPLEPPLADHIVRRCIAKDPGERWQTARDLMLELEWLGEGDRGTERVFRRHKPRLLTWVVGGLAALVLAAFFYVLTRGRPQESGLWKMALQPPEKHTITSFAASPSGDYVAFTAEGNGQSMLWLRRLDSLESAPLQGTEGASDPFWSPANSAIGFFAGGKLKKISVSGGPPQILCDAPRGNGGSWNQDGTILFTPGIFTGLYRVPAAGGKPIEITRPDPTRGENSHRWPFFLPDGKHYVYMNRSRRSGTYLGQLDSHSSTRLIDNDSASIFAASTTGQPHLLFARAHTLMAQSFELASGRMMGEPFPMIADVPVEPLRNFGSFSASTTGRLMYQQAGAAGSRRPAYVDRLGRQHDEAAAVDHYSHISVSPDGRKAALQRTVDSGRSETCILDFASHTTKIFNLTGAFPIWSADGKRILLFNSRNGVFGLVHRAVDGSDESELLAPSQEPEFPLDWSPDGRFVLYQQNNPATGSDIFLLPLAKGGKPTPLLNSAHNEWDAQFSPNGKWIAYTSDESGSPQVYVRLFQWPFPSTQPTPGPRWPVSQGGGGKPKWRHDGRELFFLAPDGHLMAAAVSGSSSVFQAEIPKQLFSTVLNTIVVAQQYTPAPDGKGFFMLQPVAEAARSLIVVSNWSKLRP